MDEDQLSAKLLHDSGCHLGEVDRSLGLEASITLTGGLQIGAHGVGRNVAVHNLQNEVTTEPLPSPFPLLHEPKAKTFSPARSCTGPANSICSNGKGRLRGGLVLGSVAVC